MKPSTMRIGYRYRPNRLAPEYDAIVIGSGMGGLTTAALLSELGWKICVLEQHYTAGGFTHAYARNGYARKSPTPASRNCGALLTMPVPPGSGVVQT